MSVSVFELPETTSVQEALAVLRAHGVRARYENFIGGKWVKPINGEYFVDSSPIDGEWLCEIARSSAADVEKALDAAHAAKDAWGDSFADGRLLHAGCGGQPRLCLCILLSHDSLLTGRRSTHLPLSASPTSRIRCAKNYFCDVSR